MHPKVQLGTFSQTKGSGVVKRRRLVLDANVWRRIVDEKSGGQLIQAATRANTTILAAPTVVYEALRTPQDELRRAILNELTARRWLRLMPEAYSESMELLGEIRRLRPDTLRAKPNMAAFAQLKASWTNQKRGFWERVRSDPTAELQALDFSGQKRLLDAGRAQARLRRKEMKAAPKWEHVPLDQIKWIPEGEHTGWNGQPVEGWRVEAFATFNFALPRRGSAYRDWLEPFCELERLMGDQIAWTRFWFEEVSVEALPRFWVRWAIEYLQRFRKVTPGTPGDSQLATHLCEADVLITEDKTLCQIVENARRYAPVQIGRAILVDGASVEAILSAVQAESAAA